MLRDGIYELLSAVEVDTKEIGRTHIEPWLSQRMLIDAVSDGIDNDVHEYVVLKARQMAMTTACSIISLFWLLANAGTQGAMIADSTANLERLRRILSNLIETLPAGWSGPEFRVLQNNRNGLVLANRSVSEFLTAGTSADLAASRALNLLHATECSLWRNPSGVESLRASLAQINPRRLYIWESIANGFNWYYDLVQRAKSDRHMRFIFIGFWANPTYAISRDDPDFRIYWDDKLTDDELSRARMVKRDYGRIVRPEQIAWYRRESEYRQEEYMLRHYPWTEIECFISSGEGYFPGRRLIEMEETMHAMPPLFRAYRYEFADRFLSSRIEQITNPDEAMLKIWEPPDPAGVYTIGVDPSGGGGGAANNHAIEVLRCYADRVVQVAEFATNLPDTYQLAWVLAHLAGAYSDHIVNLEITGVGAAIMAELRNLRQLADLGLMRTVPGVEPDPIRAMIGCVRWFLYKRPDTMSGSYVYNWKTNADNKDMIYSALRDSLVLRRLEVRSVMLLMELKAIVRSGNYIGAGEGTTESDDRVSGLALAHWAWSEWRRPALLAADKTWQKVHGGRLPDTPGGVLSYAFSDFFTRLAERKKPNRMEF